MPNKNIDPNSWSTKEIATQLADDKSTPIKVQKEGAKRLLEMLNNQTVLPIIGDKPTLVLSEKEISEMKKQEQLLADFYLNQENKKKTFWANEIQVCNVDLNIKNPESVQNKGFYYPQLNQNVPTNLCMSDKKYLTSYINCQDNPTIIFEAKEAIKLTSIDFTSDIYDKYVKYNHFNNSLVYVPQSQVFIHKDSVELAIKIIPNALSLSRDDYFLAIENLQNAVAPLCQQVLYGLIVIDLPPIFTGNTKIFTLQFLGSMINSNVVAGIGQYNVI